MLQSLALLGVVGLTVLFIAVVVPQLGWLGKILSRYNARNLVVRWPITLMLLAAFIMQVGIVVVMLAFVRGLEALTEGSSIPGNVIVMSEGSTDELFSNLGYSDISDVERLPLVLRDESTADRKPLASWEVYVVVNQPLPDAVVNSRKFGCKFASDSLRVVELPKASFFEALAAVASDPFSPLAAMSRAKGPMESAGLMAGDEVTKYNDWPVASHDELRRVMMGKQSGMITLGYMRDGKAGEGQFSVEAIRVLERARRFLQVRGIDSPETSLKVHGFELLAGKVFSEAGVRTINLNGSERTAVEAILGEGIARTLGEDVDKPSLVEGDLFYLGDSVQPFVVAGISSTSGSTFDSEIWAKQSLVGRKFGKNSFSTVVLRTQGAQEAASLSRELRDDFKKAAVRAQTEEEYYSSLNSTNKQFLYAISFVAAIVTVGGVLGLMNTMFAAISQRMKDIGVLRILGYSGFQVLAAFLCEALILAFIGGLLGCAAGSLADGFTANSIISSGQGGGKSVVLRMTVDGRIILYGMSVAMIIGLLGGALPAFNSTRIKPLDALR